MAHLSHSLFRARGLCRLSTRFCCHHRERRFLFYEHPCTPFNVLHWIQRPIYHAGHYHSHRGEFTELATQAIHSNFIQGITFCLIILQVHFDVGGNSPAEKFTEARGTLTSLFRGRDVREGFSMEPMTVHITEESAFSE